MKSKRFAFAQPPEFLEQGIFKKWFSLGEELCFYQGDSDENDRPHGKGITLEPTGGIEIGYYNHGIRHGKFIMIDDEGIQEVVEYKEGRPLTWDIESKEG